jgi:hypothetical protein
MYLESAPATPTKILQTATMPCSNCARCFCDPFSLLTV